MNKIYLDCAATTPVAEEVFEAMKPYFTEKFGNPSSVHGFGQEARAAIDNVRESIAVFLNCEPTEILFTSGGSESDNLAIRGVIEAVIPEYKGMNKKPHVVTSSIEHHAVLDTVKDLEKEGKIEVTYVSPDKDGVLNTQQVIRAIRENTVLVSIMYVNNEIGTVQPIREIGKAIEKINSLRHSELTQLSHPELAEVYGVTLWGSELDSESRKGIPKPFGLAQGGRVRDDDTKIYFHTDAVQAAEYFEMGTKYLHVDLLTMTAHKIYGPKGVGVLFVKKGTPIKPEITGGGQEYKKRAGTENVAGIVGFAKAVEMLQHNYDSHPDPSADGEGSLEIDSSSLTQNDSNRRPQNDKTLKLRDKLIRGIMERIPDADLNGAETLRSPNNVNISFRGIEGESILLNLDMLGIAASTGSACTSGSLEPSHVIMALGYPEERAHSSIRFTIGKYTKEEEIDRLLDVLPGIIEKLRAMSPIK